MSENAPGGQPDPGSPPVGGRRRWPFLLAAALATVVVIAIVLVLLFRPSGVDAPPAATASDRPVPTLTPTPIPTPVETPSGAPALGAEDRATITRAIVTGDTAPLAAYLADPTNVILCATEAFGPLSPVEALAEIDRRVADARRPWDFALPATTLDEYRVRNYGRYFPADALVGRSADGQILSFAFAGATISGVFWCAAEQIVIED